MSVFYISPVLFSHSCPHKTPRVHTHTHTHHTHIHHTHTHTHTHHTQSFYCGVDCQKLAWSTGNHRKLCKKWAKKLEQKEEQVASKDSGQEREQSEGNSHA